MAGSYASSPGTAIHMNPRAWTVKQLRWLDNCPIPEGEVLMRLKEIP
jgi:hypothetical protein